MPQCVLTAVRAQEQDDGEDIEVLRVPLAGLEAELLKHTAAGAVIYNGLFAVAAGMRLQASLRL
jgi:hypothetical protein